jgi:hypothetical protein
MFQQLFEPEVRNSQNSAAQKQKRAFWTLVRIDVAADPLFIPWLCPDSGASICKPAHLLPINWANSCCADEACS